MALTPKQEAFALAYVETGNASEAYRKVYNAQRMKPASINRKAKELLDHGKISARVAEVMAAAVSSVVMNRQQALERLTLIAETRITDILEFRTVEIKTVGKDGEEESDEQTIWLMKDSPEIEKRAAAAIKSVTMTKHGPKIEMYDARGAIEQLSKMQGWDAPQKVDHSGAVAVLGKEEYKQARREMLEDDDC